LATDLCTIDPDWPSDYQLKVELLANQLGYRICGFPTRAGTPCRVRPKKGCVRCSVHLTVRTTFSPADPAITGGNLLVGSRELAKSAEIFNLRPAIATAKWLLAREEEAFQEHFRQLQELKGEVTAPARKRQIERRLFPLLEKTNQEYITKIGDGGTPQESITDWYIGWLYKRLDGLRKTLEYQANNLANVTKRAAETETLTKDLISRTDADAVLMAMATGYANAVRESLPPDQAEELLQKIEFSINRQLRPLMEKEIVNEPEPVNGETAGGGKRKISMKAKKPESREDKERAKAVKRGKAAQAKTATKEGQAKGKKKTAKPAPRKGKAGANKRGPGRPKNSSKLSAHNKKPASE